ncbi:MAG TPA: thiamine pyrophosphate-dependent enzyme [Rhodothermales bacterium]|nr:thiamine pyrophosphate-dependent enzyme [Rhodothermales bacterium]
MSDEKHHPENGKPKGVKPTLPPGAKPAMPPAGLPAGKKPAVPGAARPAGKPAMPPAGKPAMPPGAGKKPALPGVKAPTLPPPGGDGDGALPTLSRKDFATDQDVRWCPGCGDYAILAAVQRLMPELGVPKEKTVFISGIGCSSRFPYYMNTYGMHSIHGRAPAIATGLKASRPDLDVWIITGDGDSLSIGGNHLIHLLRRNLNVQLLLFNNQIYGLTKGQYSPTSEQGKITKSTPYGSIDHPFNPVALALGADASFVARSMDRDPKHLQETLRRAHGHKGAAFVEIYQNCNIFNDGAFFSFTEKDTKAKSALFVEDGKPLLYEGGNKGLRLDGLSLEAVDLTDGKWSASDCLVYDESNREMAHLLGRIFWRQDMPRPFGVFYREERATYDDLLHTQIAGITEKRGEGDLNELLNAGETWTIS